MVGKAEIFLIFAAIALGSTQECGKLTNGNIEDTNALLPWTVEVKERSTNEVICRGVLVSNQHALIAAHCLWPKPYFKSLKVISNIFLTINGQSVELMDIKIHSDWKFNKDHFDADVAVLSLFNPITPSDKVHPICLPPLTSGSNVLVVPGGVAAGVSSLQTSNVRERVAVEKNSECFQNFPKTIQGPSTRTFCANWPGEDIHLPNSFTGGYYYNKDNSWYIQGIESESFVQKNQCEFKKHSVFTNVASYIDWIQTIVKRDTETQWKDVELKCTFIKNLEGLYGCEVEHFVVNSPSVRIASVSGQHQDRNSNAEVEYVWIKNSQVPYLPRFDAGIFFPKLKKYLVTDSGVKFVERNDFSGMPNLETLDLSNNDIEEIPDDTLFDLNELVDLFLDNNKFKAVPPKLLSHASSFQRFKANNNSIEIIDTDFFKNNSNLKIVSLDNNRLHKIDVDFRPFRNLKKVDLLNNACVSTNFNDWRRLKTAAIITKEIQETCH